jgi:diaminopimelate decarboxylase
MASANVKSALDGVATANDHLSSDADGMLQIEGRSAESLLEEFGSPLYVVSEATLRTNFRRIRDAFQSRWPRPVNVMYAIKANNNLAIRAILHEEGAGGDCFGEGELYATFLGGADHDKLVMNGTNKTYAELTAAVKAGVRVNIDGADEVAMLTEIAAETGRTARVCLRVKVTPQELEQFVPDYTARPFNMLDGVRGMQWGYSIEAATQMVPEILAAPGIELDGYHLHVGRSNPEPDYYRTLALAYVETIVELKRTTGYTPEIVNIGGGYARERDPESRSLSLNPYEIEEYAESITGPLLEGLEQAGIPIPRLWMEPGRYVVGNAVVLLGRVGTVKRDLEKVWVNVDVSVNNLMRIETAHSTYHLLAANHLLDPHDEVVDIVGPLCLGAPLGSGRTFPHVERDDIVAVLDAGMYAETAANQMNGVPRPATVLVNDDDAEVIKERESIHDVFVHHRIPVRLRGGG